MAAKKIEQNVEENIVETKEEKPVAKKEVKKFQKGDYIPCHSISGGTVILVGSKTGDKYRWIGNGATNDVAYEDLMDEVRKHNKRGILYTPLIIIDDNDFVNQNPEIKEVYDSMYTTRDLIDILDLPADAIKEIVPQLPEGASTSLKGMVSERIANGSLDSMSKIKVLDEVFDTKFMLLTELFSN